MTRDRQLHHDRAIVEVLAIALLLGSEALSLGLLFSLSTPVQGFAQCRAEG
jgi:hypothetical protein